MQLISLNYRSSKKFKFFHKGNLIASAKFAEKATCYGPVEAGEAPLASRVTTFNIMMMMMIDDDSNDVDKDENERPGGSQLLVAGWS